MNHDESWFNKFLQTYLNKSWTDSIFSLPGDGPVASSVILWLRNELRLHDNPLLQQGLERVAQGAQSLQLVVCPLAHVFWKPGWAQVE